MKRFLNVVRRELATLGRYPIYLIFMVVMPIVAVLFFTTILSSAQPTDMPVGVVDMDDSPSTRRMARLIDAFQTSEVVAKYPSLSDARRAVQRGEIYAFLYVPEGTTAKLVSGRKPTISFYYSMTSMTSGSLLFRDLKTISSLGNAALMQATLRARGATEDQIMAYLQPITVDLHPVNNPTLDYNAYLSTTLVPGVLTLFMFLLTVYSLGTELKFGTASGLLSEAGDNVCIALAGKLLPLFIFSLSLFYFYEYYVYGYLGFPHYGGPWPLVWLGLLTVLASLGFGLFMFGLLPQLRMSMSACSLWAVLSFSMVGSIFPASDMDAPLEALTWLFPLRHYFMIYQAVVFNGYPVSGVWWHVVALVVFALLPLLVLPRIRKALKYYVYVP